MTVRPRRESLTAAVVQAGADLFDTAANLRAAHTWIRAAADQGADIIVLP
ncbi:hypothetical protein [Nocardia acididurans]|nr:hypothetical protein [Nocardia acididurans]